MPEKISKMQIRAQIMHMLLKYRNNKNPLNDEVVQDIEAIKNIEDKEYVARLLFKEIASNESKEYINICSIVALEVLDKDIFENYAVDFLNNKNNSDDKKFFIISLIKQKGIYFDYEQIGNYIESPEQIAQRGVQGFLSNALYDPEVQIDLLDFYLNIPKDEKIYLLNNLAKEENQDATAHAMSLIAQLNLEDDELEIITDTLQNIKSPYAIEGIDYILNNYKINLKLRQKLKNIYEFLNEQYPDFKNNEIIKSSQLNDCFISFIDGNSNFSLVLSRKMQDNSIDTVLLTLNIKQGIVGCMGFGNITISNYVTIIRRLFSDSVPVNINPSVLKALCNFYEEKNKKSKVQIPHEYIVWKKLMTDIPDIKQNVSDLINSKLDTINLSEEKVKKFINSLMLKTWYYTYGQNSAIDKLIDKIEKEHITDIERTNILVSDLIDESFINNKAFMSEIKEKLRLSAYIAHLAKFKMSSLTSNSLCYKNPYFKMFITALIDKSLYEYFSDACGNNIQNDNKNMFYQERDTLFNSDELNKLIEQLEEKWK